MAKIPAPYPDAKQRDLTYLDNNSTTMMCKPAKDAVVKWLTARSNPSADSLLASKAKQLMIFAERYILAHIGEKAGGSGGNTGNKAAYSVIFTSGASESNSFILRSTVESFKRWKGVTPHIITSMIEHKSILDCCKYLEENGMATVSYVSPNVYGFILPSAVEKELNAQKNVALVSIMAANNEMGTINRYAEIGAVCHKHKVPFHTDAVQIFGKFRIAMKKENIDALSMSFHKLYGPMGVGLLIVKNEFLEGYKLNSQIFGSQQHALRGGTENIPLIAGSIAAMMDTFRDRAKKNAHMAALKSAFIKGLSKHVPCGDYMEYFKAAGSGDSGSNAYKDGTDEFIVLGCPVGKANKAGLACLPNTILVSFAKNSSTKAETNFCNVKLKKALDAKKIIVSVGSACNTSSAKASHVLYAIRAPDVVKRGVIRISFSDDSKKRDVITLLSTLLRELQAQRFGTV